MVDRPNHIQRNSNIQCKSSMAWLITQSNLVSSMHCNDVHIFKEIHCSPLFVVSLMLFYDIFEKTSCSPIIYRAQVTVQISHQCGACSGLPQSLRVWPSVNSNFMVEHTKVGNNKTLVLLKTTDGSKKALMQYKCCTSNSQIIVHPSNAIWNTLLVI